MRFGQQIRRARQIVREDGVVMLARRGAGYVGRTLEGGISSRPRVQRVGGLFAPVFSLVFNLRYGRGTDVVSEDWDNLILLDACRYDDFERENDIDGDLEARISRGADSERFLLRNFGSRKLHDCVYVTANPHVSKLRENVFHAIIDSPLLEWNEEFQCVLPESVTEAAIRAHERYPDKRLIVHYMQPHDPPIRDALEVFDDTDIRWGGPSSAAYDSDGARMMAEVARGRLDAETAREAYRENLRIVLEEVRELLSAVDGKSVLSADHGEMFGEQPYPLLGQLYEHGYHPRTEALCKVPWHVVDGERRDIVSEPPAESGSVAEEDIREQLESLGYR
jgi:hypothetical protein